MTPMSRSAWRKGRVPRCGAVWVEGFASWLVVCMVGAQGCFYTAPVWRPVANTPPELIEPPTADNLLIFDHDAERITVIASDPDGDNLQFIWSVPPFLETTEVTTPGDNVTFGRLDILWHPDVDGAEIRLVIVDDQREPESLTVTWLVEEP